MGSFLLSILILQQLLKQNTRKILVNGFVFTFNFNITTIFLRWINQVEAVHENISTF